MLDFLKSKDKETSNEEKSTDVDIVVEEMETEIAGPSSNKKSKHRERYNKDWISEFPWHSTVSSGSDVKGD